MAKSKKEMDTYYVAVISFKFRSKNPEEFANNLLSKLPAGAVLEDVGETMMADYDNTVPTFP